MESQYYFLPIVPQYSGAYPVVSLEGAMDGDRLIPLGKLGPLADVMTRYAATGGVVNDNRERAGILVQQRDGTFALTATPQAQRKIEHAVTGILALELDASGTVMDCYLADRPHAYEKMAKAAEMRFQKRLESERKPMTATEQLKSAIEKVYANPGILRKDGSIAPGAYAKPVDELNPPAKTPSRTPTAPNGTINVSELARANDKIRVIGEHLHAAMRENPGSVAIGDAGQSWYAITTIGLGIDSRYMDGAQTVTVAPDGQSEYLRDAWSDMYGKSAGVTFDRGFRKAVADARRGVGAQIISRNVAGQVSARPVFSKSASEADDGGSEAAQYLRRNAMESALARLQVLGQKLHEAVTASGDSMAVPHLRRAQTAHQEATKHLRACLAQEDDAK